MPSHMKPSYDAGGDCFSALAFSLCDTGRECCEYGEGVSAEARCNLRILYYVVCCIRVLYYIVYCTYYTVLYYTVVSCSLLASSPSKAGYSHYCDISHRYTTVLASVGFPGKTLLVLMHIPLASRTRRPGERAKPAKDGLDGLDGDKLRSRRTASNIGRGDEEKRKKKEVRTQWSPRVAWTRYALPAFSFVRESYRGVCSGMERGVSQVMASLD